MTGMSIWSMSLAGGVMILVITVIRALAMNRVPKKTFLVLWGAAIARLLVPFSLPSGLSVYSLLARRPARTAVSAAAVKVPAVPAGQVSTTVGQAASAAARAVPVWDIVWVAGTLLCAAVFAAAYWRCCREFRMSLPVENGFARRYLAAHPLRRRVTIRQFDRISSPLTFGVLRPVILMPKTTDWADEAALEFVLVHEFVHIRRFDAVWKLLLVAAGCAHWFNPLVWVMYVLANRDLELSCDETVVRRFGRGARAAYANVLIAMEERKSGLAPLDSHFSRNAIEERITAIMKTGKITAASLTLAAVLVAGTVTVFATSAKAEPNPASPAETTQATDAETMTDESTLMSYVDPADGRTYYSFDDGKTFEPLTDAEFEALYPTPDIEWWTYDEFKAWLDEEKVQLQSLLGETAWTNTDGEFVWTQEKIDEAITLYEEMLADIQNGVQYSKSVDGEDDVLVSYNPADVAAGTSDAELTLAVLLDNGEEVIFGPFATNEEMLAAVQPFCEEQVELGNLTQQEADEILGRYSEN